MPKPLRITASILASNLACLQAEIESVEGLVDGLQIDVMDGHFVPNLSFGAPVVSCLKTSLPLDIHLMVENPEERIEEFLELHASNITFHAEAITEPDDRLALIAAIRDGGATAGIALNPSTPLDAVKDLLGAIDLLLIMTVEPGFSGQKFLPETLEKVRSARASHPDLAIQVDGGIDAQTAVECVRAGATNLVSASYIFGASNRREAINRLRQTA
jgi:ribulose-phosphate 3-epimerase